MIPGPGIPYPDISVRKVGEVILVTNERQDDRGREEQAAGSGHAEVPDAIRNFNLADQARFGSGPDLDIAVVTRKRACKLYPCPNVLEVKGFLDFKSRY